MAAPLLAMAGTGIGAGAAAVSWVEYARLVELHKARTANRENDLVEGGQVDAALLQASVDSVFLFVDLALLPAAVRAAREPLASALTGPNARRAIEESVAEHGIQATIKASGRSADELAEIVGKDTPRGRSLTKAALESHDVVTATGRRVDVDAVLKLMSNRSASAVEKNTAQLVRDKPSGSTRSRTCRATPITNDASPAASWIPTSGTCSPLPPTVSRSKSSAAQLDR